MRYTSAALITALRITGIPRKGQTVSGYGGAIPTRYLVRYGSRWYRVKVMQYGNAGTAYITVKGEDLALDSDSEAKIETLWNEIHTSQLQG